MGTVVVTAQRPEKQPTAEAETRIRETVARQATAFGKLLSFCLEGPVTNPDVKILCGRSHIKARDKSLGEGLAAFEQRDYPTALRRFEAAHAKLGNHDAALMLAHMHRHGLGTRQDPVQGIRWLRAVAEDRFDPRFDGMRFNPAKPEATTARIDAAVALASIYQLGDEAERDLDEAGKWYARAAEFGFVPARNAANEARLSAEGVTGRVHTLGENAVAEAGNTQAFRKEPAGLPDAMPGLAADDADDMAADSLNLALSRLASNPSDIEAASKLRRAADKLHIAASPVAENQGDVGEVMFVVRVTGLRAVPWKSYGAMRAAAAAYEKHKSLAPDAVFRFAVMPPAGMKLPPNFALRVRTDKGQEHPIRLEHGELFTLPPLPDLEGDADLVSNFKGGALRIGLLVHTRTVSPEKLRLGDLRLRYQINAAIMMFEEPWEYDAQCKGRSRWNRCKRPSQAIWHQPWAATSGAWIVEGNRRTPLQASEDSQKQAYRMPIASADWSNDAMIEFDYKAPPLRPRKLFEAAIYDAND